MNELDILKLEKELLKNKKKLFSIYINHKKRYILDGLMIVLPIENILWGIGTQFFPFYGLALCSFCTGFRHIKTLQKNENEKEFKEEIRKKIKTTDTYKSLENEYLSYITTLANFIRKIGMISGMEVAILYNFLLEFGYLSKNHQHQYEYINKKIESEMFKYEIPELVGSRVATGQSVCRHMSGMLTDLENEIGNKAINLPVAKTKKKSTKIVIIDHLTSIIQDNKTKLVFGYCPTNNEIFKTEIINDSITLENTNRKYLSYNIHDIIDNHLMIDYNSRYLQNIESIFNDNLKEEKDIKLYIPTREISKTINNIFPYFFKNHQELEEFYQSTKNQLENIDSLLNKLYPQEYNKRGKVLKHVIK